MYSECSHRAQALLCERRGGRRGLSLYSLWRRKATMNERRQRQMDSGARSVLCDKKQCQMIWGFFTMPG